MARPSFKPTTTQRTQVAVAAAGGMVHEEIAAALGISRNTLEKHFDAELSTGASRRRLSWLMAMDLAARKGNVAAQKALLATTPTLGVPPAPAPAQAEEKPAKKLGKKEQAALDATTAAQGTEWGDILPRPGTVMQ